MGFISDKRKRENEKQDCKFVRTTADSTKAEAFSSTNCDLAKVGGYPPFETPSKTPLFFDLRRFFCLEVVMYTLNEKNANLGLIRRFLKF